MLKLSFTSRLLDLLGRVFIGTPADLLVLNDFYYLSGDRYRWSADDFKDPAFVRRRITVNHFRRNLFVSVYRVASVISAAVSLVLFTVLLGIGAVRSASPGIAITGSAAAPNLSANCEQGLALYKDHKLSPDQATQFQKQCGP